ncbi:MAG TPA: DUF167 domain-containing protein [Opitutales bacterium]|nr:DUF167 domain-containing protein [Opitutales bacterium]
MSLSSKSATIEVRVTPKASRTEVVGWEGDVLRIRLHALPVEGEANAELIRYLAKGLKLPKSALELVGGGKSRNKRVMIQHLDLESVKSLLTSLV